MKKSRIFMATGTLALAIAAMFATKANKKFTGVTTAYINGSGGLRVKAPSGLFTTANTGTLKTAFATVFTAQGSSKIAATLCTNVSTNHNHKIYWN